MVGFVLQLPVANGLRCTVGRRDVLALSNILSVGGREEMKPYFRRRRRCRVVTSSSSMPSEDDTSSNKAEEMVEYYRPKIDDIHLENEKEKVRRGMATWRCEPKPKFLFHPR